jgi:general secretion pathway protein C
MQRRRLWRIAAVSLLGLCAGWTAMALLCVRITGRMVSAVEQLDGVAMATNTAHAAAPPPVCDHSPPPAPPVEPQWPVGLGILKLGETEFLVDHRVIDVVFEEQAAIMRRPRIVPEPESGKVVGFRLFGVRPDSLLGHLGIENGDRVQSVNGFDVGTQDEALAMYARLRSSDDLFVTVMRRGSKVKLEYHLV